MKLEHLSLWERKACRLRPLLLPASLHLLSDFFSSAVSEVKAALTRLGRKTLVSRHSC